MKITGTEIFIIPIGNEVDLAENDICIVYSPLKDVTALVTADDAKALSQYFTEGDALCDDALSDLALDLASDEVVNDGTAPDIDKITKMSILPNLTCNFSCSYCYSAKGRSNTVISWEKLQASLDYFIDPHRISPQAISLFVSGGGEPFLSWNLLRQLIVYARERAKQFGFDLRISIITNGSMVNKEKALFLKQNDCSVCVSFEVLQDLQNDERRLFDLVSSNIKLLGEVGVTTLINSTITPVSVCRLSEMVQQIAKDYPFVAQYTMEPVTSDTLFASSDELRDFYKHFYEEYLKAKVLAKQNNVPLRFTFDDALRGITVRHCPGKFCITPQGTISICHLASSPKEKRYNRCIYGRIDEKGKVLIDHNYFKELYGVNVFHYARCAECFAKWSCGGECLARNELYSSEFMEEVCRFNRMFIKHLLVEQIENSIKDQYGKSLKEYVNE